MAAKPKTAQETEVQTTFAGLEGEQYHVRLTFQERLLGTMPRDPSILSTYLQSKAHPPLSDERRQEEVDTLPGTEEETRGTGFPFDDRGLFLWDYHLRGYLKEAARVLRLSVPGRRKAEVALTDRLLEQYVYVFPRRLHLMREGQIVKEPDGVFERPLRAMTAQGPRVSIAVSEYLDPPLYLEARIFVLRGPISVELSQALLPYGQLTGLGQWRTGGNGRFVVEVIG